MGKCNELVLRWALNHPYSRVGGLINGYPYSYRVYPPTRMGYPYPCRSLPMIKDFQCWRFGFTSASLSCSYPQVYQTLKHPTDLPISSNNMKYFAAILTALLCVLSAALALPSPQSPMCDPPVCGEDPACPDESYAVVSGNCYKCCF